MKVLILSMEAAGHFNACTGLAEILHKLGHQVHYGLPDSATDYVHGYDFMKLHLFKKKDDKVIENTMQKWAKDKDGKTYVFNLEPIDQIEGISIGALQFFTRFNINYHESYEKLIKEISPDVICVDSYTQVPAIITSGIPWILVYSANPLLAYQPLGAPPPFTGYALDEDPAKCEEYRKKRNECLKEGREAYAKWMASKGHVTDENSSELSPFLNIYAYPEDVDYSELGPVPEGWFRFEHFIRPVNDAPIGIDGEENLLTQTSKKKVFFSLGSLGCRDENIFKKFIGYMSKSEHIFIISLGDAYGTVDLPSNVIGGKFLNQLKLLPHVDLVVTHGGNNTFVETLYHGKPLIVLPLFGDQHDNGRRVVDKKIGKCLKLYKVTEKEFLETVDELLSDEELRKKVEKIGENMRKRQTIALQKFDEKLREICAKHQAKN
ncbi:demethyllactenocin mycarosyltransferase-like [Brevipalpus obovatus]|uniref:demethyllactenocin mycarosyltransferase-like n=1 Tax=Brevipalpus obovatus TaxID=246614 RepID=UPI003D9F7170